MVTLRNFRNDAREGFVVKRLEVLSKVLWLDLALGAELVSRVPQHRKQSLVEARRGSGGNQGVIGVRVGSGRPTHQT